MSQVVSLELTPVCRNADDPTWSEPFLQAVQWAFENQHEILADARRVCHRDFCESLLSQWPEEDEIPGIVAAVARLCQVSIKVAWEDGVLEGVFEDELQLLLAFGRIITERAAKGRLLVSTKVSHFTENDGR